MPKFAANLTLLFPELPMLERFGAAQAAGFDYVEMQLPYAWPVTQLADILKEHKLQMILHNLPSGDWDAGERGIACLPDRINEYRDGVELAISYAKVLGVKQINSLAGIVPANLSREAAQACFVENLVFTARRLQEEGIQALIEPINTYNVPNFFLSHTQQALQIIELVRQAGQGNLFVEYDIFHAQRMEGDLGHTLRTHIDAIAHIQFADNPGRHQPGTGEINFPYIFNLLDEIGYTGFVAAEYHPKGSTAESLEWGRPWLRPARQA